MRTRSRYLTVAVAALGTVALASSPVSSQLRAGAAAVEITPPAGSLLYGYGARGTNRSTGVHDPLYARALVLEAAGETVALVTLDLGSIRKENTLPIRQAVLDAAGFEHVLLNASHTHSAPLFEAGFPSAGSPWVRQLEQKIVDVILEAHDALRPARVAVGWGRASEGHNRRRVLPDGSVEMFWRNRERLPTAPLDESVGVLAVDGADGEAIATVVNFAVHPVILGPENMLVSADFPGAMAALVAERGGGVPMLLQGAAGDINPFWDKTPPAEGGFEQVRMAGERLGQEVLRIRADLAAVEAFHDPATLSVKRHLVTLDPRWDLDSPVVEEGFRRHGLEASLRRYRARFPREREAEVNTLVLGGRGAGQFALATFPGEFFVEHQLRLRAEAQVPHVFFAGYTNGELAYFPTIAAAAQGGYGGREATIVEVGAGEKLVDLAAISILEQAGWLHDAPP
ncbi:MAG: neutral/alkaline non-lysosomal ceramidase N-terminal domain-containing protein [Acidobacteriota bacterium]|nr:neutral/alkaline non-lysosomal ceramidase N-terminal domain-containing protein [Acidobacteriota bacterium]